MSTSGEVLERDAEFVSATIRILVWCVPLVQICVDNFFTVECHSNDASIACDAHLIPLTGGFTSVPGRSQGIVECSTVVAISGLLAVCI